MRGFQPILDHLDRSGERGVCFAQVTKGIEIGLDLFSVILLTHRSELRFDFLGVIHINLFLQCSLHVGLRLSDATHCALVFECL